MSFQLGNHVMCCYRFIWYSHKDGVRITLQSLSRLFWRWAVRWAGQRFAIIPATVLAFESNPIFDNNALWVNYFSVNRSHLDSKFSKLLQILVQVFSAQRTFHPFISLDMVLLSGTFKFVVSSLLMHNVDSRHFQL